MKYLMLSLLLLTSCAKETKIYSIYAEVFGKTLIISTSDKMAGAIDSVIWDNKQFINSVDHGREMQTATTYDGYGECLNPTEAGSGLDGDSSTSQASDISVAANEMFTTSKMAYWVRVGQPYEFGCGVPRQYFTKNTTNLSNDILKKHVTIGSLGFKNVIKEDISVYVAEDHQSSTFEVVTGYMTAEFSEFYILDKSGITALVKNYASYENKPTIFATKDGKYAMGVYFPAFNALTDVYLTYQFDNNTDTKKWSIYRRKEATPQGYYNFTVYEIIGTLEQVETTMKELIK